MHSFVMKVEEAVGPLFYITNSTEIISLTGVIVSTSSGTLVNASAGSWGARGCNQASGMALCSGS